MSTAERSRRGNLRVYLSAASGAGTTYAMLDEGLRRAARGTEVVIGCVTPHDRPLTLAKQAELAGVGATVPSMLDLEAALERQPDVVLVDDLAFDNPVGSRHRHRWEDVESLLDAGIDVVTTTTVQHIESLSDPVRQIVGSVPPALVPDEVLARADQVELIDIAPDAIRRRIAHGNVFRSGDDPAALELFNSDAFARLRLLMLSWMTDRVAASMSPEAWTESRERVVVAVSGAPSGDAVVRRAARLALRSRATLVGVHVHDPSRPVDTAAIDRARRLLDELGGSLREVESDDVASALVAFAAAEGATQLVVGTSATGRRRSRSVVAAVVARVAGVDVHVVAHDDGSSDGRARQRSPRPVVTPRRRWVASVMGAVLLTVLTLAFVELRDRIGVSTALGLYLLVVVGVAALGGLLPGVVAALVAPLLANWFLIEPYHTLRVSDPENLVELLVFLSVAVTISTFVSVAARRATEAEVARREAASLATLAGSSGPDALQMMVQQLCTTFALDGVAVLDGTGATVVPVAVAGREPPARAAAADFVEQIGPGVVVALAGRAVSMEQDRVLRVFLRQIAKAVEQHRVAEVAAEATALSKTDELRTALLRAVGHDLRSPLASIKASVSSLRQPDVEWPDDVRDEFLSSIEAETDRLTTIVSNLLDMSRLQAGALRPAIRMIPLEEVLPTTVHGLGERAAKVDLLIPADVPDVVADPALLERVLANLISNAVEFSPPDRRVRVQVQRVGNDVHIYVVDHGRGIRPRDRSVVLQPFHRLDDSASNSGVGLGLAIADGLTAAMGGTLELRDTPGGGLTAVVSLPMWLEQGETG